MSVLMTKKKADAIASAERDQHLLTDKAARERVLEAEPERKRKSLRKVAESRWLQDFRMRAGK
jgi:hypothetical protein